MSTGDKRNSLVGKTVSGNRLNIFEAIKKIRTEFDNCINLPSAKGPIKINYISIDGLLLKIDYLSPDSKPLTLLLYDNMGHIVYQSIITPPEVGGKVYNLNSFPEIPGVYHVSLVSEITSASKSFIIL